MRSAPQFDAPGGIHGPDVLCTDAWSRLDLGDLIAKGPPPVDWVVDGLIEAGSVTYMHGDSGAGKSLFALIAALAVATGASLGGRSVTQGGVVYIDGENSRQEIHRRITALNATPEASDRIGYYPSVSGALTDVGHRQLTRLVKTHTPRLLVLDTFRALFDGEENDGHEVTQALKRIRDLAEATGTGALILGHDRKSTKDGAGGGFRGSSGLKASVDSMLQLRKRGHTIMIALGPSGKDRSGQLDLPLEIDLTSHMTMDEQSDHVGPRSPDLPSRIIETLRQSHDGMTATELERSVGGRAQLVVAARADLVKENRIREERVGNRVICRLA